MPRSALLLLAGIGIGQWLFCGLIGLVGAGIARGVFAGTGLSDRLCVVIAACLAWLLSFGW